MFGSDATKLVITDGASIELGGYCPGTDWPAELLPLLADPTWRSGLNISVDGASEFHLGSIPFRTSYSNVLFIFGDMWPNNIRNGQTAASINAYLGSCIAAVRSIGVPRIAVCTGYIVTTMSDPEKTTLLELNDLIRARAAVDLAIIEFSSFDASIYTADGGHPTCPLSPVPGYAGVGTVVLAGLAAPTVNMLISG